MLVRRREAIEVRIETAGMTRGGGTAGIDSITIGGRGASAAFTRHEASCMSLPDPVTGVYVLRARHDAGQPFLLSMHVLVDEPCPMPRVAAGSRLCRGSAPLRLLQSEAFTADVAWPYARGVVSAVAAGSERRLHLPCPASALGAGSHEVLVTSTLEGCVPTSVTVLLVVDAVLAAPRLDVVHALLVGPDGTLATTRRSSLTAGSHSFLAPNARIEVYVDDDAEDVSLVVVDADSRMELWRMEELRHGWADVSRVLGVLATRQPSGVGGGGECRLSVIARAPGCHDGVAGPFRVTVGHVCAVPRFVRTPVPRFVRTHALPAVFALSGGPALEVRVPDGLGEVPSARGLLFITLLREDGDARLLLLQPDERGVVLLPVMRTLHGGAILQHRRLGCAPSAPLEVDFVIDATLEPPAVTAWPVDGSEGRLLALSDDAHVLSSEELEIGPPGLHGAVVTLTAADDRCAPVTLLEFPARVAALPGAGHRRVTLALEAPGVFCPAPRVLIVDASPTTVPMLTSHKLRAVSSLFIAASDALEFSPPASGFPGAQLQLTCSTLALPVVVPSASAAAPPSVRVRALFDTAAADGIPAGTVIAVAVREVAPGCLPGPPLQFSCTVDYALPAPTLDAASGVVLPGDGTPLLLFGLARFALSEACDAPSGVLTVTLTSDAGERTNVPVPVPLGARELWVPLPSDLRSSQLVLTLNAPGCTSPPPSVAIHVDVTTAPDYIARAAGVDDTVAGLLVAAGYTTIWQLRLLNKAAAKAAGVKPGDMYCLFDTTGALLAVQDMVMPLAPPAQLVLRRTVVPLAPRAEPPGNTPVWRFVSRALRGVDEAVLEGVVLYLEDQKLASERALARLAVDTSAAEVDLAIGGRILPGYRASLLAALRDAAPSAGGIRIRSNVGNAYRHARITVTRVLPGHGGRVQFGFWTISDAGVEATREVVLKLAGSRGEVDILLAAHEALDGTGAVARRLAMLLPSDELGEARYALVLEKVGCSLEECIGAPDFPHVPAPIRETIARALLGALGKLHDAKWTHGDMWEANVMVEWNGLMVRVVLIDLDQAMRVGNPLPARGEMALTPVCAAPEYLRRKMCDAGTAGAATVASIAADTFCAGLVLARLLGSGSRVFADEAAALSALLPAGGGLPAGALAALTEPHAALVRGLCAPEPGDRLAIPGALERLTMGTVGAACDVLEAKGQTIAAMKTALMALRGLSALADSERVEMERLLRLLRAAGVSV